MATCLHGLSGADWDILSAVYRRTVLIQVMRNLPRHCVFCDCFGDTTLPSGQRPRVAHASSPNLSRHYHAYQGTTIHPTPTATPCVPDDLIFRDDGLPRAIQCTTFPANTMWRKLLYSGFETCFGPSTQGAETKTHLKSRFCAILKKGALCKNLRSTGPCSGSIDNIANILRYLYEKPPHNGRKCG